ncbi:MAG TPA: extracellular solute-binding protein, partial [Rhizomicrobium sp.]|nr:extracellular solute-binding protein [Rhizomicrobium sp.]
MKRRSLLAAVAALPLAALAQGKPEKLVFVGDNGPWHGCLVDEVAPAFEKATGIRIDFTLLPIDALSARLKGELNSGSPDIDIIQWTATFAGWLAPHMADHAKLLADNAGKHPDFDWNDFLPPVRDLASYQGKLLGIPYRVTTSVLTYQKQLLTEAGFAVPPANWENFLAAAQATTKPPARYGLGIWGRQGPAMLGGYTPFLYGNGGRYFDPKTFEIEINGAKAVEALQFYGDLMTRYKVVVPDSITWEYDEIVAGGQNDRYAMTITLAP